MRCIVTLLVLAAVITAPAVYAQIPPYAHEFPFDNMLDPRPYDHDVDPDTNMFISHWTESMPRQLFGSLIVRDILTPCDGDPIHPKRKGAVLTVMSDVSYAYIEPGHATVPSSLDGRQMVFYIHKGRGILTSGGRITELRPGIGILLPAGIEFTMKNTGGDFLTMFIVSEDIPDDFIPAADIVVRDEYEIPIKNSNNHWANSVRPMFKQEDGLAHIGGMAVVTIFPGTMAHPHSHDDDEECWFAIDGDTTLLLGKKLHPLPAGSAYKIPTDGITAHANINVSDKPIKLMWFEQPLPRIYHSKKKYARLDPWPYTPGKDPDIDLYMGSWKESMPRHTHGSLIERDILTQGDPANPGRRGTVLQYVNRFVYATLHSGASTIPVTLDGEQEILYILSGSGTISAAGETFDLYPGISVLVPGKLEFTMKNTGDDELSMYLIAEPYPEGFRTNDHLLVADENTVPISTSEAHWCGIVKQFFKTSDGLGTLESVLTCAFDPMTFFQPHSHDGNVEEVWTALDDNTWVLLGKQIRRQASGTAYIIPNDNNTPHANFNASHDKTIKLFYFARYRDHELRK